MKCSSTTGHTPWIQYWTLQVSSSGSLWCSFNGTICIVEDIRPRTRLISRILPPWVKGLKTLSIFCICLIYCIFYILCILQVLGTLSDCVSIYQWTWQSNHCHGEESQYATYWWRCCTLLWCYQCKLWRSRRGPQDLGKTTRCLHQSRASSTVEYDVAFLAQGSQFIAVRSCTR